MSSKVTLQDIADRLRLSRTTISLALRDHPRISVSTKQRVRKLVSQMGYEPDRVARSLATGRSNLIGLLVPNSTNLYYAEVIRGIEEAAREAGLHVVLANGSYDLAVEESRMKEMMLLRAAGVIAAPAFDSARPRLSAFWEGLRQAHFPLVLINRLLTPPLFHQISADLDAGMRLALEALKSLGHHRVAYITGTPRTTPSRQRLAAFRRLAREFGFDLSPHLIVQGELGIRGGYEACRKLWEEIIDKPTAIVTLSDAEALGVLRYLRNKKVDVPGEVSVMGFDGFETAEFAWVSLSTVTTPMKEIGRRAVQLLTTAIKNGVQAPQNVVLPVSLSLRESVGPARC